MAPARRQDKSATIEFDLRAAPAAAEAMKDRRAIDDETVGLLPPLLSPEFAGATEPLAVILDLPMQDFCGHLARLTQDLSVDAGGIVWKKITALRNA